VLDGCRLDELLLRVLDGDTLGEQLGGEPSLDVCRLPLAVSTPGSGELQFRH
jgi:hypothetical protein